MYVQFVKQDIVGIYRLCGATTKKNILRLAFEESADIVDLSSMNVPDINVITSEFASFLHHMEMWANQAQYRVTTLPNSSFELLQAF